MQTIKTNGSFWINNEVRKAEIQRVMLIKTQEQTNNLSKFVYSQKQNKEGSRLLMGKTLEGGESKSLKLF